MVVFYFYFFLIRGHSTFELNIYFSRTEVGVALIAHLNRTFIFILFFYFQELEWEFLFGDE